MKNIHTSTPHLHTALDSNPYVVDYPLTQETIITLMDMFLTNGKHQILVKNPAIGRLIVKTMLDATNHYHYPAVISAFSTDDHFSVNVWEHFLETIDTQGLHYMHEYILYNWHFDFLLIELSQALRSMPWFSLYEHESDYLDHVRAIPTIYLTYR